MAFEVKMPQLGLTMEEGTVTKWVKQEGDTYGISFKYCHIDSQTYQCHHAKQQSAGKSYFYFF